MKATQTGLWHKAPDGTEIERLSAPKEPVYDANAIGRQLVELTAMDTYWNSWFAREGIKPFLVHYEDLSEEPSKLLGKLLEQLGLDRKLSRGIALPVAKLADVTNKRWAMRFLAEASEQ